MIIEYLGLSRIDGSLVMLDGVKNASYDEMVELKLADGSSRTGRIVQINGEQVVIQVFEGTKGLSLVNTRTHMTGHPIQFGLSPEIIGRVFDGLGRPADGLGEIFPLIKRDVNGSPINPVSRVYPKNYISTGISTIDCLTTLIRGQKLPIFSGSGMKHNELAVQIVRQASISDSEDFAIVFAAMGVKNDVADYFRRSFEKSNVMNKVVMFLNHANDPIVERIMTPRFALTAAEYLAFDLDYNVLVILTDMTSYAEALREFSSSKGEIPGRKGFPGYLYSDFASIYERAGIIEGSKGSVTQIPILTMPNDDITHPIPDLTGYITEGQIVLDRTLDTIGIYPPVSVLPSLSRRITVSWPTSSFPPMPGCRTQSPLRVLSARMSCRIPIKSCWNSARRSRQNLLPRGQMKTAASSRRWIWAGSCCPCCPVKSLTGWTMKPFANIIKETPQKRLPRNALSRGVKAR